jgi:hypothetical protein
LRWLTVVSKRDCVVFGWGRRIRFWRVFPGGRRRRGLISFFLDTRHRRLISPRAAPSTMAMIHALAAASALWLLQVRRFTLTETM